MWEYQWVPALNLVRALSDASVPKDQTLLDEFFFGRFVWEDGNVDACAYMRLYEGFTLGNIYKSSFKAIMDDATPFLLVALLAPLAGAILAVAVSRAAVSLTAFVAVLGGGARGRGSKLRLRREERLLIGREDDFRYGLGGRVRIRAAEFIVLAVGELPLFVEMHLNELVVTDVAILLVRAIDDTHAVGEKIRDVNNSSFE